MSRLVNRNVVAGTGRTSMRLEPELWDALLEICQREEKDLHSVIKGGMQRAMLADAPARYAYSCCSISAQRRPRPAIRRPAMGLM
jgi:hypothetical protein